jgi:hypothetical protein
VNREHEQWQELARQLRIDVVRATAAPGSGHPTSSLSAADLMAVLLEGHLRYDFSRPSDPGNDRLIFSKGHAAPLLYAMCKAAGAISHELVDLGSEATRIPVGGGFAGIIGDGSVNDEGWIEVFQSGRDRLAVLHVSGQPYDHVLKDALAYPTDADAHGGTLTLPGGELALFSSALDEVRDNSVPLVRASPGPTPRAYRPASMSTPRAEVVTGLLVALPAGAYRLQVRWRTGVAEDAVFARWLLSP